MSSKKRFPSRREPRQQRAHDTIEVILQASAHVLRAEGLEGFTTNHVARRAGVSIGSIYQYFANKETLITEVRRRYEAAFREQLIAAAGEIGVLPPADGIHRLVRLLATLHADDPGLHNALASQASDTERLVFERLIASYLSANRDEVRRPDLPIAAGVTLQIAETLIHETAVREPERLEDEAFLSEVTDVLVRYLIR